MARPGFYNDNRNRAYPFVQGTVGLAQHTSPNALKYLIDAAIVDCGFRPGPESGFVDGTDTVYLQQLSRAGPVFFFVFASTAGPLFGQNLTFTRTLGDPEYALEYMESGQPVSAGSDSAFDPASDFADCAMPLWSGFLVTGDLDALAAWITDGQTLTNTGGEAVVEPALVQNLAATFVEALAVANADRTRATAADGCTDPVWPFPTGIVYVVSRCVQGGVLLKPGYNCQVTQDDGSGTITIAAEVGAGAGQPCSEVPLFPGETAPEGSSLLSGGLACNEVLRSINGIGGPVFSLLAGNGVVITSDPESRTVVVDVNMINLATCFDGLSQVSESL